MDPNATVPRPGRTGGHPSHQGGSPVATEYRVTAAPAPDAASAETAGEAGEAGALRPRFSIGRREPRWRKRRRNQPVFKAISIMSVVLGLALWELTARLGIVDKTFSSSPALIYQALVRMVDNGTLQSALASSVRLYLVGLGISVVAGITGGVVLGWWRALGAVFDPWIAMLYSTPLIALLPLIIVWFGIGFTGQVVMVILISLFPLLVSVMTGTRQVDDLLLRMALSFGASQWAILRTLVLPSLVPYAVAGLRLSVSTALIGMVIGEYFMGTDGIGKIILQSGVTLDTSGVFVGVFILAFAAVSLNILIRTLERKVSSWRE